jgi:hypothetical protein
MERGFPDETCSRAQLNQKSAAERSQNQKDPSRTKEIIMKQKLYILIIVAVLALTTVSPVSASGGKVRGEKGQGDVNQCFVGVTANPWENQPQHQMH